MLPKQNRLPLRTEFERIRKEGKLFPGRLFSLLLASGESVYSKFAFVVSKKIDKRATKRNRVRRLMSEAVRGFLPKIKPGVVGAFLAKKSIVDGEFAEIKNEIEKIFQKANLFEE